MSQGKYVGVIVGLIDGDRTIVQSFGETAKGSGRAPNEHTLFEISSISKTLVATILADVAGRTDLELTDPVRDYLPNGVRLAAIDGWEATLEDLAVHTAGLPYLPEDYEPPEGINPYSGYTTDDLWYSVNAFSPTRRAGQEHSYSAFGYGILTQVLSLHAVRDLGGRVGRRVAMPGDVLPGDGEHVRADELESGGVSPPSRRASVRPSLRAERGGTPPSQQRG